MAKMSKDELLNKINEKETITEDDKIELMEDITDSFEEGQAGDEDYKEKYETEVKAHEETKRKYKERFLESKKETKEDDDEVIEKKEIDIKEI